MLKFNQDFKRPEKNPKNAPYNIWLHFLFLFK